ncbi:eukaryotic translation initiation factor 4 gamma 1 isoform X3 [Pelobates cultripes]|uniref:Eukaryotic translation initiation factor 4 gamma 1 isoform X3 n=1 Tax=Pelobates cultripes TaxID=61616 RepID=A0AAD1SQV8_PELCU|nr:eukaryotic translation initiation factor 4 gamma 1 isoform X3 [Pelobates cultripes]
MGNVISMIERPLVSRLGGTQPPPRNSTKKEFRKQPNIQPSTDRLALKAEPQTFPQISPNLDISPETEKGKRREPREQNGGFVEEVLKCCQEGTFRRRLPPSVTSKFAVLDKSFRHYETYVRYKKEEKIPDVPYYIRVTPKKSNVEIRYARPPRDPFLFSKVKPTLLLTQYKTTKKARNVTEKEVGKKRLENAETFCAECYKQNNILLSEPVTSVDDFVCQPSTGSFRHNNNYVRSGKEEKIPDVPYYTRVTPKKPMTYARPPSRLALKSEPQTFPQISPNLDISPETEKGKRREPREQNGGFVEEVLKRCQEGTKSLCPPPSVTSKFAVLDKRHNNNYVRSGKEEKIPDVPYYTRVTPTITNKPMTYVRPPRLALKAEPQTFPQISPNLDISLETEKGKRREPWEQNGGFVEEVLKRCQEGTKSLCPPPSVPSKFAVLDKRHNNNYVRYGKEEKIPDVPCYIRVTPTITNKPMTYVRPPRDPFLFSKVKPTLLPEKHIATIKDASVPEKQVDTNGLENEKKYSAEYCDQIPILQPEPITRLEDIPCPLLKSMSLEPTEVITRLEDNSSLECTVCTIEPHTNRLTEEIPVHLGHPQSSSSCSPELTNLDSQNPITVHCHSVQFMSPEPTEVITHLEDNNSLECTVCTIEPHTNILTEEIPVHLRHPQSSSTCSPELTHLDSQDPITVQEPGSLLESPVCPAKPHTGEMLEELPVNNVTYHSETNLDSPTIQPEGLLQINQEGIAEQNQTEIKNNQPEARVSLSSDPGEQPLPKKEDKEKGPPGEAGIVPMQITESQDLAVPALQEKTNIKTKVERIRYDRDSLLQFQSTTLQPKDFFEILNIYQGMLIRPHLRPVHPSQLTSKNCTPISENVSRRAKGNHRQRPGMGQMRSHHTPGKEPRRILQLHENITLQKSDKAWKPPMKRANKDTNNVKTQELLCKVRGILNKITPQTFQNLIKQLKDLSVETEYELKGVVELIFEKAIAEPHFAVIYASMCNWLMRLQVPTEDNREICITFRRQLISLCQREFERGENGGERIEKLQKELDAATLPEEKSRLKEELSEACKKSRKRSQGNIKFIGELCKLKLLSEDTMKDILSKLLNRNSEESMECICLLLTSIGKYLENGESYMDDYFNKVGICIKNKTISSRIRFMVQDVLDLRKNHWIPRHKPQGPKTIDQIHKEAELESRGKAQ